MYLYTKKIMCRHLGVFYYEKKMNLWGKMSKIIYLNLSGRSRIRKTPSVP